MRQKTFIWRLAYPEANRRAAGSGAGGSFLGTKYTRRHYCEIWMSDLFDDSVDERWAADGEKTLKQRVQAKVQRLRAAEQPFALSAAKEAGLEAILAEVQAHESERIQVRFEPSSPNTLEERRRGGRAALPRSGPAARPLASA